MLHSHPFDTCSAWSNFKETYFGLVCAWANKPPMFIINILYTLYRENIYLGNISKLNNKR